LKDQIRLPESRCQQRKSGLQLLDLVYAEAAQLAKIARMKII
jgi:hypothetical protein